MTTTKAPTYTRPGHPDGAHPLAVLAFLGALFGAGALGWALFIGVCWLVWTYTLVAGSAIVSLAVVTFCAYLAIRGNRRARVLAAVIGGALVVLVAWVVTL
jgi:hypothetical protein